MTENTIDPHTETFMKGLILNCQAGRNRTLAEMTQNENSPEFKRNLVLNNSVVSYVKKLLLTSNDESITVRVSEDVIRVFSDKKDKGLPINGITCSDLTDVLVPYYDAILQTLRATKGLIDVTMPSSHVEYIEYCLTIRSDLPDKRINRQLYSLLLILQNKGYDNWGVASGDEFTRSEAEKVGSTMIRMGYKHEQFKERFLVSEAGTAGTQILKEMCSWINLGKVDKQSLLDKFSMLE